MASHFKWYPGSEDVTIPFNARYSFPSQSNKTIKMTPRIPPKTGSVYQPGGQMRIELPAQGYMHPGNSTLEFDVTLTGWGTSGGEITRFQNNIQSLFNRVRILYGSTPLEDIINYNVIVRSLTEWTSTNQLVVDQQSIADGVGGVVWGTDGVGNVGMVNVRQKYIQGIDNSNITTGVAVVGGKGFGKVPNGDVVRRYQVHLATGLFTQEKLIPLKFMASQFVIEITFESAASCIISQKGASTAGVEPTYSVSNVNFLPEILEFDASYDAVFLQGLRQGGVPILFASWHTFMFGTGSAVNLMVQERSRSVKALFTVMRRKPEVVLTDSHATFFATSGYMVNYQYRIGGRYYPPSPVQLSNTSSTPGTNGGAEAYCELEKALNIVGDYRLSTGCNVTRWALMPSSANMTNPHIPGGGGGFNTANSEMDYWPTLGGYNAAGQPGLALTTVAGTVAVTNSYSGTIASSCYASAISLETSNGMEISGLNSEEQSDIAFIGTWSAAQNTDFQMEVYSYYDSMIILRENNVLELIQ